MPNHAAGPCPRNYAWDFWHTTLEAAANTEITGAALTTTRAAGDTGLTFPEASTASAVT
jgi:hypothetical protein